MKRSMLFVFVFAINLGVFGRNVIEVESRYVGNGCFQYSLRTLEDPFVTDIFFGYMGPYPFTNYVSNTLPPHWTNSISEENWWGIAYDASAPQPRVNETSFSVCSSSTSFRREQYGFQTTFALLLADCFQTRYWAGTFNSPCLVPCAPEEADGSDHQMVFRFEIVPDLIINQLIVTNGEVHGVTFSWVSASTVELQGSHDLSYWTPVARLAGYSPATTWTTNSSLNACGKFFRLRAISVKN